MKTSSPLSIKRVISGISRLATLTCIIILFACARSEDIAPGPGLEEKIVWEIKHAINLDDAGDSFAYDCKFVTEGLKAILWDQKGVGGNSEFVITNRTGVWADVTLDGEVLYQVEQDGLTGSIKIKRLSGKAEITLDLGVSGGRYRFEVEKISTSN